MNRPHLLHAMLSVHMEDVNKARDLLRTALDTCGKEWVPCHAVADALAAEMAAFVQRNGLSEHAADYLRALARSLDGVPSDARN